MTFWKAWRIVKTVESSLNKEWDRDYQKQFIMEDGSSNFHVGYLYPKLMQ